MDPIIRYSGLGQELCRLLFLRVYDNCVLGPLELKHVKSLAQGLEQPLTLRTWCWVRRLLADADCVRQIRAIAEDLQQWIASTGESLQNGLDLNLATSR